MKSLKRLEGKRWFIWAIVVIVIGLGGLAAYIYVSSVNESTGAVPTMVVHPDGGGKTTGTRSLAAGLPPIPAPTGTPSDTSKWKTYVDKQYGFEFKYPPTGWGVQSDSGGVSLFATPRERPCGDNGGYCDHYTISVDITVHPLGVAAAPTDPDSFIAYVLREGAGGRQEIKGFQAYTLNGQPAYHIVWYPNSGVDDDTYLFHNGYVFDIPNEFHPDVLYGSMNGLDLMSINDGVVSTFKFTN